MSVVHILDYVAGNVRSLVNAIEKLGFKVQWITKPGDIHGAEVGQITIKIYGLVSSLPPTKLRGSLFRALAISDIALPSSLKVVTWNPFATTLRLGSHLWEFVLVCKPCLRALPKVRACLVLVLHQEG